MTSNAESNERRAGQASVPEGARFCLHLRSLYELAPLPDEFRRLAVEIRDRLLMQQAKSG